MEVDDIHSPASKYSRVNSNGERLDSAKIGLIGGNGSGGGGASLEDRTNVIRRAGPAITATSGGGGDVVGGGRFGRQWQHSSRIIRVSRASGGKDRHSKVWTAKGPRDRRVRLSVNTAIQFYDLQDRLGYDQPSKAVEWLIKAAADSINELPSLNTTNFPPETPRQLSDERRSGNLVLSSADAELDCNQNNMVQGQQQQVGTGSLSMSKSGCSSNNSETSKGSGLSLSRTEIRVKARERARERTAKDKDKDTEPSSRVSVAAHPHHNSNNHNQHQQPMTQTSSFTQLLTAGINNLNENAAASSTPSPHHSGGGRGRDVADSTTTLQWLSSSCTTPMADYFGTGLMGLSASRPTNNSIHQQLGNGPLPHVMSLLPFSTSQEISHHQQQQQHFPFLHDHSFMPVPSNNTPRAGANGGSSSDNYNLNFSISSSSTTSGLAAGFNRGTLQSNSNSPSLLSYLQRFSSTADGGSSVPFFLGGAPISPVVQNQHHHNHHQEFNPAGLQLCYGDGTHHSDQKGKGKN